jgi:hypothetical protein
MNLLPIRIVFLLGLMAVLHMVLLTDLTRGQETSSRQPADISIDSIFYRNDFRSETFIGQWQSGSQGFERIKRNAENGRHFDHSSRSQRFGS